jgi:TRAP-type C4-dicarboxylate transport system substrate-binding protein
MMNERRYRALDAAQQTILHEAVLAAGVTFSAASEHGFTEKRELARQQEQVTAIEPAPGPWRDKGKMVLANLTQAGVVPKELAEKAAALS